MKILAVSIAFRKRFLRSIWLLLLFLVSLILTLSIQLLPVAATTPNTNELFNQAEHLYQEEKYNEAVSLWQQLEADYQQKGDVLNQAMALNDLALTYQNLDRLPEAYEAIAKSLTLLGYNPQVTEPQQGSNERKRVLAQSLDIRGHHYFLTGKMEESLQTWRTSGDLYNQIQDEPRRIQNLINQSQALQSLGKFLEAKRTLQTLEASWESATIELQVKGFRSLGNVLRQIGELNESEKYLRESLNLAEKLHPETISAVYLDLGITQVALGEKNKVIGKEKDAKGYFYQALDSYQRSAKSDKLKLQSQLNQIALILEHQALLNSSTISLEELVTDTQDLIEKLPPSRSAISSRIRMAKLMMKKGENKEAIAQLLDTAIQQASNMDDKRSHSYSLGTYGTLLEENNQLDEALQITNQALSISQSINAPDITYRWQWQAGRVLKKKREIEQATLYYEKAIETLKVVRYNLLPINPDVQFSFRDNVEPVYRELVDLLLTDPEPTQDNLQKAIKQIDDLQLAELEDHLRCNLSKSVYLNQFSGDPKAAVVYPILLENRLAVILQLAGDLHYFTPPNTSKNDVEQVIKQLREELRESGEYNEVKKQSKHLYNWIISNFEIDLNQHSEIKTLVFVLDGELRNIPMNVLYDEDKREYLLQKYAIALAPGLQLIDPKPLQFSRLKVLMAGLSEDLELSGEIIQKLKDVQRELSEIRSLVSDSEELDPFTLDRLQSKINSTNFTAVHIATHGQFSADPEETYISTSEGKLTSSDLNNLLRTSSFREVNPIELLVLSACQTALGDRRAVLGLSGIAVRAGARSTLGTLWFVEDQSTTDLMIEFYRELTQPETSKAEALRRAQQHILETKPDPYFWAGFVVVGNWL